MKTLASAHHLQEIRTRLGALTASERAAWGSMSVGEMVCHLRDAYVMALGELSAAPVKRELPGKIFKALALYVPMRWPQNYATVPELDYRGNALAPAAFDSGRERLRETVERFAASRVSNTHPIFGRMSVRDWMRWGYLHADHHLRQFGR